MIEEIMNNTTEYMAVFPKGIRKSYGQFFTSIPTAKYMASLASTKLTTVNILDAGCGNAILAASVIVELLSKGHLRNINLTLYETDSNIIELLNKNIELVRYECHRQNVSLQVTLYQENFITHNSDKWKDKNFLGCYDIAICNPPYLKISKAASESRCM